MAALWRRLKEEDWVRLLGPCLITFAIPLLVPGFTLTLVAFSDETGFSKFSALHIVGMIILAVACLLIVVGCVLRCKTKNSVRIAPDSERSDVVSLEDTQDYRSHNRFSTHASTVNERTDMREHSPSTSETSVNTHPSRDRRTSRSAQKRLTHDMESVLCSTEQDTHTRTGSVMNRQFSGGGNYMSEDEEDRKAELQQMAESAAILQATHDLDDTSTYSSSSSYSTECSSSASESDERSGYPPQKLLQSGPGRMNTPESSRSEVDWIRREAPVASLGLLTANEFASVDQGRQELTYRADTGAQANERRKRERTTEKRQRTESEKSVEKRKRDRDGTYVQKDDSEETHKRKNKQQIFDFSIERYAGAREKGDSEKIPEISIENAAVESISVPNTDVGENQTVIPSTTDLGENQTVVSERKSPPPYSGLVFPPPDSNDTSPDEQNSSDSPSQGSYYFIHPEQQSQGSSQRLSDEGEVFGENTYPKTDELLTVDETTRPLSPLVPLRRSMGVSEYRTTDSEAENVTVFSRGQASIFGGNISEGSPTRNQEITKTESRPSEVEDTGHETGDLQEERKERERKKKKKKRKKAKKERKKERILSDVTTAEAEMSPQELAGHDDLPLRSIMHPQPNVMHRVHWPDEDDML